MSDSIEFIVNPRVWKDFDFLIGEDLNGSSRCFEFPVVLDVVQGYECAGKTIYSVKQCLVYRCNKYETKCRDYSELEKRTKVVARR